MLNLRHRWGMFLLCLTIVVSGCLGKKEPEERHYLGEEDLQYYKNQATEVAFPAIEQCPTPQVHLSQGPRTIAERKNDEICDITLDECIMRAIQNNRIIRTFNSQTGTSQLLAAPDGVGSVYDPAIQESGVLFGRRGVEAALADFDARLATSMFWGRDESYLNIPVAAGSPAIGVSNETAAFRSSLSKAFGYGGSLTVANDWDYLGTNRGSTALFDSSYTGTVRADYVHPLLAGSGTEFTRIAGPINPNSDLTGITGVSQGVLIARINGDISIADFEANVRDMMLAIENAYWDLYLQYRLFDTAVLARNSALRSWEQAKNIEAAGAGNKYNEPLARDRYFETQAQVETALNNVYNAELALRQLMNMPVNDGCVLRPVDEPTIAKVDPDWRVCLTEALTNRVELRRQKWSIKSLELQLCAAQSLTRPRLDFVSSYQVNGFGDDLLDYNDNDGTTTTGLGSALGTLTSGDLTGWDLGVRFSMPIGFRQAHAQVRNYELRIAKARQLLAAQEVDVSHELAGSFQNLVATYTTAQSNYNRLLAAQRREEVLRQLWEGGSRVEGQLGALLDLLLRAQESAAFAQANYWQSVTSYNQQLAQLHAAKGTLLVQYNIQLAESEWTPAAYKDALERAWARTYAFENTWLETEPCEFGIPTGHPYEHMTPLGTRQEPTLVEPPEPGMPLGPQEEYDEDMPLEQELPVLPKEGDLNEENALFQAIPMLSPKGKQPVKTPVASTTPAKPTGPGSLNQLQKPVQPVSANLSVKKPQPATWQATRKSEPPATLPEPEIVIPDEYRQPIDPRPVQPAAMQDDQPVAEPVQQTGWRKRTN